MDGIETTDALLDDPGDLDIIGEGDISAVIDERTIENITALQADDDPVHLAKCAECATAVKFRSNVTGTGFFLVDADPDAVFGVGEHGRPVCPNGHGEMAIADDALKPVPEAFADAQTMLQRAEADASGKPVQGDLPGILPLFNYQGCYLELEEKAAEVNALHEEYLEAKEAATDAKKAWDKAAELYTKMALEFRRRRQAKGDVSDAPTLADPPSRALLCTWDQAHPDDACPLCAVSTFADRDAIVTLIGEEILPKESNGHADQVVTYRTRADVAATADALDGVLYDVHDATIAEWTPEQRAEVRAWSTGPDNSWEQAPTVLGRPHIAAKADDGATVQACSECGAVLRTWNEGDGSIVWLPTCARVGTDCAGAQAEPEHHYPEKKPKAKRAKATEEKPAPKKRGKGRK